MPKAVKTKRGRCNIIRQTVNMMRQNVEGATRTNGASTFVCTNASEPFNSPGPTIVAFGTSIIILQVGKEGSGHIPRSRVANCINDIPATSSCSIATYDAWVRSCS